MKPGPSSDRLFSKCPQSTMSRASPVTSSSSCAGSPRPWSHNRRDRAQTVKFALAAALIPGSVERVGPPAEVETKRHRAQVEVAPHRVQEVAAIAFRKFLEPVAEHNEARRPALHLRDVAELDPLAPRRRRRVGLDRSREPAVELPGRNALVPSLAKLERYLQHRVDALAGLG